ncbi:epsilon adaptin, putative [Bodo saltans]|uniref:AP-4 complex subunit epsilon n=1 Tax=Bodo saltans TaxID=75058 RepID=A0A0S4JAH1_BODSA|nr:epsilon adaptin, putative [Bodo saltans]|eukprot:CUG87244.1 epsilon adaptin, putative [Bodo saltans]
MSKLHKAQTQQGHSRPFFEYIKSIGEAKSKQEEDKIVTKDLIELKKSLSDKHVDKKLLKEYVVRTFYAEMLGHNADFGHIHCVNLSSNSDLHFKRTGYLATWLCVNPEHEFMYLVVSNLQRDMKSNSFLEISSALTAASKLIRPELMTCINSDVAGLLAHSNALVRKKAVLCMHAFFRKSDGLIGDHKLFRQALCDRDPSVMGASLGLFYDVILNDVEGQRDLLPSLVLILKQIVEHRLSRDFDYHRVPAPWLQIKLLKLIAVLGADNKAMTEKCAEVLEEVIKRADSGLNIGHAVVVEAINAITSVYPVPSLIELAADAISKFLASNSSNLKYLGITALSRIVKIDRKYAQEHQGTVIACLEDADDTIRRKTLSLLIAMCNERNVEVIVQRLTKYLAGSTDQFLRRELVRNICDLAERFSAGAQWYVETMNKILDIGAEHVQQSTIQGLLKLIAEGEGEDEAEDAELRAFCVETYFAITDHSDKNIPMALYQVAAWVMGEYGFLTKRVSRSMMLDRLSDMAERVADANTRGWIVTAMMKIVAHNGSMPDNVEDAIGKLKTSRSVGLQQRCYEFQELVKMPLIMKRCLPLDGCCEEIELDEGLSFLDSLVDDALSKGARPYSKKDVRLGGNDQDGALRTDAYKTQRADVVDEDDLDAKKFETDENAEKLVIKDGSRRWGAKNLEEEAAVDQPVDSIAEPNEDHSAENGTSATGGQNTHVDPVAIDAPRKPTKNEKLMSDIFGGGKERKKKAGGASRAREARRRAEEADEATKDLTSDNTSFTRPVSMLEQQGGIAAPPAPSRRTIGGGATLTSSTAAEQQPPAAAASSSSSSKVAAKVQFNIQKQLGPDGLRFRVGVMSDQPLDRAYLTIEAPAKCVADEIKANAPGASVNGSVITFPTIPANEPVFTELALKATDYPVGGGLSAEISFGSAAGPGSARGGLPLGFTDLLRPAPLTTDQFGQAWGKHAGESKVALRFNKPLTPELLQQHIGERASLKIIQVIGKECIAAARVIPVNSLVLCHMVVDPTGVNATIRTNSKEFSDIVTKTLAAGLSA